MSTDLPMKHRVERYLMAFRLTIYVEIHCVSILSILMLLPVEKISFEGLVGQLSMHERPVAKMDTHSYRATSIHAHVEGEPAKSARGIIGFNGMRRIEHERHYS